MARRATDKSNKGGQALAKERKMGRHEWRRHGALDARQRAFKDADEVANTARGLQLHKPGSAKK